MPATVVSEGAAKVMCRIAACGRFLIILLISLILAGWAGVGRAADAQGYLEQLQRRAVILDLATSPAWHALLHYEPDWSGRGVVSTVASGWFFLADDGEHDPAAELAASLAAFFTTMPISPKSRPPRCALPARFDYFVHALSIDVTRLPQLRCPDYREWLAKLNPAAINLVYAAQYPNRPASMLGHMLLRIDSRRTSQAGKLLTHAVNYVADTAEGSGVETIFDGLTGNYPGFFTVRPYYLVYKQYLWTQGRDMWVYPLHLSAAELHRMMAHLWAMLQVKFPFYFLNRNCGYQFLALLDVARPDLHLTRGFDWYAIPVDTIRALRSVPGLLGQVEYRPAMKTVVQWQGKQLVASRLKLAVAVASGRLPPDDPKLRRLPTRARARVLDVAHDYLYDEIQQGVVARDAARPRALQILRARSAIKMSSDFQPLPVPATSPDEGHRTLRVSLDGVWEDNVFSLGMHIRPAYHDLLDDPDGYKPGFAIQVLDLGLRLNPETTDVRVERLTLARVISMMPRGGLFKPVSWQLGTGLRRRPSPVVFTDAPNNLGYYVQGGPGLAWGDAAMLGYAFGLASLDVNSALKPAYVVGAGGSVGVLAHIGTNWQLRGEVGYLHYVVGARGHYGWARLGQQWDISGRLGLRMSVGWVETTAGDGAQVRLGLRAYF